MGGRTQLLAHRAQQVACREVHHAKLLDEPRALRALSATRPAHHKIHNGLRRMHRGQRLVPRRQATNLLLLKLLLLRGRREHASKAPQWPVRDSATRGGGAEDKANLEEEA